MSEPLSYRPGQPEPLELATGQHHEIQLEETFYLSLQLVDELHAPLAHERVQVELPERTEERSTDSWGRFVLADVPLGDHRVSIPERDDLRPVFAPAVRDYLLVVPTLVPRSGPDAGE